MADKAQVHVEFFNEPKLNKPATASAGRPIYKDREMVRIRIPGDNKLAPVFLASDRAARGEMGEEIPYSELYPLHYEQFKKGQSALVDGTPLAELTFLPAAKVKELQAVNIWTVEMLAGLGSAGIKKLGMGTQELVLQAQDYLSRADGNSEISAATAEIEMLKAKIASMEASGKAPEPEPELSEFAVFSDDELKAEIKRLTGAAPRGTPSRATLEAMLTEAQEADE